MPVSELRHALRALGYFPTLEELKKLEDGLGGKAEVNFEEFIEFLKKADKKSTPDSELLNSAFSEFDVEGTGLMTPKHLRYSMNISHTPLPGLLIFQGSESLAFLLLLQFSPRWASLGQMRRLMSSLNIWGLTTSPFPTDVKPLLLTLLFFSPVVSDPPSFLCCLS